MAGKSVISETSTLNAIRAELSQGPVRLFRQTVGEFWTGNAVTLKKGVCYVENGDVLIRNPRRVPVGFEGWPDLGGWVQVTVTPEMVGQKIAVACEIEVKRPSGGNRRKRQKEFIAFSISQGVRAGFARSVDEARAIIYGPTDGA